MQLRSKLSLTYPHTFERIWRHESMTQSRNEKWQSKNEA